MLERRDEPYIGYEIKVDYTSLGERQILASSSNKGNIFLFNITSCFFKTLR